MDTIIVTEKSPKYECIYCDYKCCKNSEYIKHTKTRKHIKMEQEYKKNTTHIEHFCECGKKYSYHSGLWKHKKTCTYNFTKSPLEINKSPLEINESHLFEPNLSDKEIIKMLIKENSEFKNLILEIVKKDTQSINNSNNTNCNNVNNSFNLNLFLNEKCKDAINISDFVDNIKLQLTDLETTGRVGYVDGVSKILIKNLNELDTYSRPIHCSDLKREVLYIKDNDQWTKESDDKPVLKNMIKQVANKNIKQIQAWKDNNPGCCNSDSKKNNQYLNIVMNSMSGGSNEEQTTNISQIMKNVAKVVTIDKLTEK